MFFSIFALCVTDAIVIVSAIEIDQPRFRIFPGVSVECVLTNKLFNWMGDAEEELAAQMANDDDGAAAALTPEQLARGATAQSSAPTRSLLFYARVTVVLFANVALWNSAWILLDSNIYDNVFNRNAIYVVLGAWLVYIGDAGAGACGVYPARSVVSEVVQEGELDNAYVYDSDDAAEEGDDNLGTTEV